MTRPDPAKVCLLRSLPDGTRQVSWRVWVLLFITPALFFGAGACYALVSLDKMATWTPPIAEVVPVCDWPGGTLWQGNTSDYSPLMRHVFTGNEVVEASPGQSSPNWNYEIGSRHPILFDPTPKTDVPLPVFEHLWALSLTLWTFAALLLIPALFAAYRVEWWRRRVVGKGRS